MPQLTQLRLCNIGHAQARIDDLTVPLHDVEGQAANTTIWLRNGGGKSMIVDLFLWLMCPDKKMPDDRHIEDYVQFQDRSVIVAEWQLDGNNYHHTFPQSTRYLTGVFCEWRSNGEQLRRLFFVTRVVPGEPRLSLKDLPIYVVKNETSERRTLASFKQEWQDLGITYPHAGINEAESLRDWRSLLQQARIDPELFSYQIKMNSREGGAEDIFKFRDADRFVDFFLELMTNGKLGNATAQTIDQFRIALQKQAEQLQPEYGLISHILERLEPLRDAAGERLQMYHRVQQIRHTLDSLTCHVSQRTTELRQDKETGKQQYDEARLEAKRLRSEAEQRQQRAAILRHAAAYKRVARLNAEQQALQEQIQTARINQIIWHAAVPLRAALRAEERAAMLQERLAVKRKEHAPLLEMLQNSARMYAAALQARIQQLHAEEYQWAQVKQEAKNEICAANTEITNKQTAATELEQQAKNISNRLIVFHQIRADLENQGTLLPGENHLQAQERFDQQHAQLRRELQVENQIDRRAKQDKEDIQRNIVKLERENVQAAADEIQVNEKLNKAREKRQDIEIDSRLRQYLELEEVDVEQLDYHALDQLRQVEHDIDSRIMKLRLEIVEHEAIIRYLQEQRLLPPTRDVERTLALLREKQVTAWSGWGYIAENVRKVEVRALLKRMPELAFGIVVRDVHYQHAKEVLLNIQLHLDTLVIVASQEAAQRDIPSQVLVIGPTSDAYFDREAGDQELPELQTRCDRDQQDQKMWQNEREALRSSIGELKQFFQDYPSHLLNEWRAAFSKATERKRNSQNLLDELHCQKQRLEDIYEQSQNNQEELQTKMRVIEKHQTRIEALSTQLAIKTEELEHERHRYLNDADNRRREAEILQVKAKEYERQSEDASDREKQVAKEAGVFSDRLSVVKYRTSEHPQPQPGDLEILRDQYEQLVAEYEQKIGEDEINAMLQIAQKEEREARQILNKRLETSIDVAMVRSALASLSDPDEIDQRHYDAIRAESSAEKELETKKDETSQAKQVLHEAKQRCVAFGIAESGQDKDIPFSEIECEISAMEEERQKRALENEATEQDKLAQIASEQLQKINSLLQKLESLHDQIQTTLGGYKSLFNSASVMTASVELLPIPLQDDILDQEFKQLYSQLDEERERTQRLDNQRTEATQSIRKLLSEASAVHPKVTIVRRLLEYNEEDYERDCSQRLEDLGVRKQRIEEELADIQKHQHLIVTHVLELANMGIRLLKSLMRRSRLPASLPDFEQRPFIKITLRDSLTPDEQQAKIGELLESIIREGTMLNGVELLQRAVRRLAGPIKVELLFPDPNALHYVSITQLAKESGGERLTSIILLYCALIQLRAIERTQQTDASSSLILDNPIGAASRPMFLELQREVAQAMNIQLIYTTAIHDIEAIRMISNIVRLRNDYVDTKSGEHLIVPAKQHQGLQAMQIVLPEEDEDSTEDEQKQ